MATTQWYYAKGDQRTGPVDDSAFRQLVESGGLEPFDRVWKKGMEQWLPAASIPGVLPNATPVSVHEWYYAEGLERRGPVSFERLEQLVAEQKLGPSDWVWNESQDAWRPVCEIEALASLLNSARKTATTAILPSSATSPRRSPRKPLNKRHIQLGVETVGLLLCVLGIWMFFGSGSDSATTSEATGESPALTETAPNADEDTRRLVDGKPRVSHTESGAPTSSADSDQIPLEFNLDDPYATHLWFKSEEERRSRIREPLVQREEGEKFEQYMQTFVGKRVKIVLTFFSVGNDNTLFTGKSLAGFGVVTRERLKIGTDISEGFARSLRKDDRFFGEATIDKVENRGLRLIVSDLTAIEELAEWNGLPKRNHPPEGTPATSSPVLTDEEKLEALVNRVRPGMTSRQVTSILGQPDAKERKDLGDFNPAKRGQILEIWTWKTDPTIMLSFVDGSLRDGGTPGYDIQKGFTPKQPE